VAVGPVSCRLAERLPCPLDARVGSRGGGCQRRPLVVVLLGAGVGDGCRRAQAGAGALDPERGVVREVSRRADGLRGERLGDSGSRVVVPFDARDGDVGTGRREQRRLAADTDVAAGLGGERRVDEPAEVGVARVTGVDERLARRRAAHA
jgi:hypothetical protein